MSRQFSPVTELLTIVYLTQKVCAGPSQAFLGDLPWEYVRIWVLT